MERTAMDLLRSAVSGVSPSRPVGRVRAVQGHVIEVVGLEEVVRLGDRLRLFRSDGSHLEGEVLTLAPDCIRMLPDSISTRVALADSVIALGQATIAPRSDWVGRVIDPHGQPMDGRGIRAGNTPLDVNAAPPPAMSRKAMGPRLNTGFHLLNTMLPLVRGQRIGVFAGSGVGKTTFLANLVKSLEADVVVLALVGERAREIRQFVHETLGENGLKRTVVVASAADAAPTQRFRCPLTAMRIAEAFRDEGQHVLLVVDSLTRFAEAHREIAISAGEFPGLRGFPVSTAANLTRLVERAGPGAVGSGDITAVFSVLVAGSDMNEPVADMLRGVLDGHLILDRDLAEQGHFPAINVLKSVSRALPDAATPEENTLIGRVRHLIHTYELTSSLIATGLYKRGADPEVDTAIDFHKAFKAFATGRGSRDVASSFERLEFLRRKAEN